ncbi:zinc-ribbon domain-containing protein, partial [Mitsuaria sp. WAJ17]|uniref:zinc-ribbon domain-containing protein n=1 Tax=Mitsuaria sp. WAJ17 TaxID=2761452 RepID=UPI001600E642
MSLATRCTACGTIFRVVQDQLRVSEGWVRCGRCAEVFDAREQLFDLDREAPPPWPPAGREHVIDSPAEEAFAPAQPPAPASRVTATALPPAPSPAPPPPATPSRPL